MAEAAAVPWIVGVEASGNELSSVERVMICVGGLLSTRDGVPVG